MNQRKEKSLASGVGAMVLVAALAIGSGWLASQPSNVSILAALGWIGILVLMIIVNVV